MKILLISTDLLVQSRIATAASRLGLAPPKAVGWQASAVLADDMDLAIVILDLSTPGLDVAQAVSAFRDHLPKPTPIIAFAPHVHTAKLAAARQAGCDQVLSRGQFEREIDSVLSGLASGGPRSGGRSME
jgi:DNA-binding NarL/FixJ family response regulator